MIPYGGNCKIYVYTDCGYPSLRLDGTDLDLILGYNKTEWADPQSFVPSRDNFDAALKVEGNWTLGEHEKSDKPYGEGGCQKTLMMLMITNLYKKDQAARYLAEQKTAVLFYEVTSG